MRKVLFFVLTFALVVSFALSASAYQVISTNVLNPSTGKTLRGLLYMPEIHSGQKIPLVICAHELGSNHRRRWPQYGESLAAEGIAVYTFDFAGGGPKSRGYNQPGNISDGDTTEMSVMTEVLDLESVIASAKGWDFVDPSKIALIGGSQGGAVSVITASKHADELAGLVLLYPALLIQDDLHKKFQRKEDCPPVYSYNGWLDVSPIYVNDMWDYDIYADMPKFTKPVLILHGDKDNIVPMNYIERAAKTYPDSEFHIINDGVHGFQDKTFAQAIGYIKAYFRKIGLMPGGLSRIIPVGTYHIKEQGIFSAGGVVLSTDGKFDPVHGQFDPKGQTHHADHANVLYQIPEGSSKLPMVFLHGYGQSRMGWMTTPDGRPGWSDIFLRKGYGVYLVDQPRRGEAGQTSKAAEISTLTQDQNWYTQFRIGLWPKTYEGSQFPDDPESLNQFFRQMTPNTGDFDVNVIVAAFVKIFERSGNGILFTHSQGGIPGWNIAIESDKVKAVVAVEPGGLFYFPEGETPENIPTNYAPVRAQAVSPENFAKLIDQPIIIYFGDYIPDEPVEIPSRDYWRGVRAMAFKFAECVNKHGGDCTVIDLPKIGITGNEHFIFQDKNNDVVAEHVAEWLKSKGM